MNKQTLAVNTQLTSQEARCLERFLAGFEWADCLISMGDVDQAMALQSAVGKLRNALQEPPLCEVCATRHWPECPHEFTTAFRLTVVVKTGRTAIIRDCFAHCEGLMREAAKAGWAEGLQEGRSQ